MRDERYEVNHCSETEEMPNQVERRWSRMEWSRVSKAADRSRIQRQETCCMEMALERWSCRESSVVEGEKVGENELGWKGGVGLWVEMKL